MKKVLLSLLLFLFPFAAFCQKDFMDSTMERINRLVDTLKEYKEVCNFTSSTLGAQKYVKTLWYDSVTVRERSIPKNLVTVQIGYYEIEPDGFIVLYEAYYSIKDDKILSVSKRQ